jgi:hypothetical protein
MAAPPATITDSRQGVGTLKLGDAATGVDFAAQTSAVKLTPSVNSEDGTPTLAVPKPAALTTITWALNLSAIQDWEDPEGLVNYLMDHALDEVAFSWEPLTGAGPTFEGTVQIVPMEVGGDVAVQVVTDVELPLVGEPTRTDLPPAGARSSSKDKAE